MAKFIHVVQSVYISAKDCDLWINTDSIESVQKEGDNLIVCIKGDEGLKYFTDGSDALSYNELMEHLFPKHYSPGCTDF